MKFAHLGVVAMCDEEMVMYKKLAALIITSSIMASNAMAVPVNLVANGDFEAGNTDFASAYAYVPGSNGAEGQYTVRSNPYPWNGAFISTGDHTTGSGLMFVGNGSPVANQIVWQSQSISVDSATSYFFEAFVNNVCCSTFSYGAGSESILEFSLSFNGGAPISLGVITTDLLLAGTWEGLSTSWASLGAGNVVLSLVNQNTNAGGNDFAIDDIYFGTESIVNPDPDPVPEPAALSLLGLGVIGILFGRCRKRV